jgi:hypothetical protein
MSNPRRYRGIFGCDRDEIPEVQIRAEAMYNGLGSDKATYAGPSPGLPAFLILIQNLASSQQTALARGRGSAAVRNAARDLLWIGMESERTYVQGLADVSSSPITVIQNAGLVVAQFPLHVKSFLELTLGKQSGTVVCDANVGMLVGTGTKKPHQSRFFNWQYTTTGGASYITLPSTPTGKTTIANLTPLTLVGVRVSLTNSTGPGPWSEVATILVR